MTPFPSSPPGTDAVALSTFTARPPSLETIDVSVLVPAKDEAENLPLFMKLAAEAFAKTPDV